MEAATIPSDHSGVTARVDGVTFDASVACGDDVLHLLDEVTEWDTLRRLMAVRTFRAAAVFADLHAPDREAGLRRRASDGRQRATCVGAEGTPPVLESAPALLAVRLGLSPYSAARLIGDALDVRHRLPRLWALLSAGHVEVWLARKVAQRTRHLSAEAAGWVDREVSEYADGRLPWSRFETMLDGKIVAADPALAEERERKAAEDRFVRVGRSNEHGVKAIYIRALGRDAVYFDAMVEQVAAALAHFTDTQETDRPSESHDVRRARAIGIMAQPVLLARLLMAYAEATAGASEAPAAEPAAESGTADTSAFARANEADLPQLLDLPPLPRLGELATLAAARLLAPKAVVYLHLDGAAVQRGEDGVVRWEGEGPVTMAYLREHFGPHCQIVVKPVVDLARAAAVDAYEVPDSQREAVHLRSPADVFPYAGNLSRSKDLDHTEEYVPPDNGGPPGQTHPGNLGPMVRFHHRLKTHGGWDVVQPFPGVFIWRSPLGDYLLEDHTGTRRLRGLVA